MDDDRITELFWQRSEQAITAVDEKFGKLCRSIAFNLLQNEQDAEECVNDAFYALWDTIPPHRPEKLMPFAAKITRNLALKRLTRQSAAKRAAVTVPIEELNACLPAKETAEQVLETSELRRLLTEFLEELAPLDRDIFLRRYWFFDTVGQIAKGCGMTAGSVKTRLYRIRRELKMYLEQEAQIYV